MFRLKDWHLECWQFRKEYVVALGECYGNPKFMEGYPIHTSAVEHIEVDSEKGFLRLHTRSGSCYEVMLWEVQASALEETKRILRKRDIFLDEAAWELLIQEREVREKKDWLSRNMASNSLSGNEFVVLAWGRDILCEEGQLVKIEGMSKEKIKACPDEKEKGDERESGEKDEFRRTEGLVTLPRVQRILSELVEKKKLSVFWIALDAREVAKLTKPWVYQSCMEERKEQQEKAGSMFEIYCEALTLLSVRKLQKEMEALCLCTAPMLLFYGRPLTKEQVMELITGEEPLFEEGGHKARGMEWRNENRVLGDIFYRSAYQAGLSSWVYADGTIGGSRNPGRNLREWLPAYMHLAEKYPFLDMVISYTDMLKSCCLGCDTVPGVCTCKDCEPFRDKLRQYDPLWHWSFEEHSDFEEQYFRTWGSHVRSDGGAFVVLTVWIHFGEAEILTGKEAVSKFYEYRERYCASEYEFMFRQGVFRYGLNCICSKEFVEDCFVYQGKPGSLCDTCVEQGVLRPFPKEARVVTKEWVKEQYRSVIKGEEGDDL